MFMSGANPLWAATLFSFVSIHVGSAVVFQQSAIILANMAAGAEASFGGGSVFRGEGVDRENVVILQEVVLGDVVVRKGMVVKVDLFIRGDMDFIVAVVVRREMEV